MKKLKKFKTFRIASAFLLLGASSAFAASGVEVVISVPLETNLGVAGVRSTQQVWLEMIGRAQSSIDLEQFYVYNKPGESLDPILAAIRAAAGRGVQVRLLLDSKFLKTYPSDAQALSQVNGIQVRSIDFSSSGGVQHAKYFVVDQVDSFLGSANFDWLALSHIHEVGLRVTDARIGARAESVFEKDWAAGDSISDKAARPAPSRPAPAAAAASVKGFELVASPLSRNPDGVSDTLSAITRLMGEARASLKIQVYQYGTQINHSSQRWLVLDSAIRAAAARGVRVQLLVDAVSLKAGRADLKSLAGVGGIEVRAVTVPQWSGGVIPFSRLVHSKYFVVDGVAGWVGSENWTESYFSSTRNVGVAFAASEVASGLNQVFDQVWNSGYASSL